MTLARVLTHLIIALVALLTLLMLILQKDVWIIAVLLVGGYVMNLALTIYELEERGAEYRRFR